MTSIPSLFLQRHNNEKKIRLIFKDRQPSKNNHRMFKTYQSLDQIRKNQNSFNDYQKGNKLIKDMPNINYCNSFSKTLKGHSLESQISNNNLKYTNYETFMANKNRIKTEINENTHKMYITKIQYEPQDFYLKEQSSVYEFVKQINRKNPINKRQQNLNLIKQIKQRHIRFKNQIKQKYKNKMNGKSLIIQKIQIDDSIKSFCNQNINKIKPNNLSMDINGAFFNRRKKKYVQCYNNKIIHQKKPQSRIMPWDVGFDVNNEDLRIQTSF